MRASRFVGIVGAALVLVLGYVLVTNFAQGSQDRNGGVFDFHGLEASVSNEELETIVPLVVEGTPRSWEVVSLADHPGVPVDPTEEGRNMIDSGASVLEIAFRVERWDKGSTPVNLTILVGITRMTSEHTVGGELLEDVSGFKVGDRFRVWLEPSRWFVGDYWIPQRVRQL